MTIFIINSICIIGTQHTLMEFLHHNFNVKYSHENYEPSEYVMTVQNNFL